MKIMKSSFLMIKTIFSFKKKIHILKKVNNFLKIQIPQKNQNHSINKIKMRIFPKILVTSHNYFTLSCCKK